MKITETYIKLNSPEELEEAIDFYVKNGSSDYMYNIRVTEDAEYLRCDEKGVLYSGRSSNYLHSKFKYTEIKMEKEGNVNLTLEDAKRLYNSGVENFRILALSAYDEEELSKTHWERIFRTSTTVTIEYCKKEFKVLASFTNDYDYGLYHLGKYENCFVLFKRVDHGGNIYTCEPTLYWPVGLFNFLKNNEDFND